MNQFYLKKLEECLKWYEDNHVDFYRFKSKDEVKDYIKDSDMPIQSDYEFIYYIRTILKYMLNDYDSHTRIKLANMNNLGFNFRIYDGDVYVMNSIYDVPNYSKLISINDIPIKEIEESISNSTCYIVKEYLEVTTEDILNSSDILTIPGLKDKLIYKFKDDNGEYDIKVNPKRNREVKLDKKDNYSYEILGDTIVFTYNSCTSPNDDIDYMYKIIDKLESDIKDLDINRFIVDLRGNSGGDGRIIRPLIKYIDEREYDTIGITDKYVFSSGRWAIEDLRRIGATIIGTNIATPRNCFGESRPNATIKLNDEEVLLKASDAYFYINEDGNLWKTKEKEVVDSFDMNMFKPEFIEPDIYIENKIDDFKNNKDSVLDYALNYKVRRI